MQPEVQSSTRGSLAVSAGAFEIARLFKALQKFSDKFNFNNINKRKTSEGVNDNDEVPH